MADIEKYKYVLFNIVILMIILEVSMLQKEMTKFTRDIEHIRWLSEQQLEKSRDSTGIESPKVLVRIQG